MCIGRNLAKLKMLYNYQKYVFTIKIFHEHLQYACSIPTKYQKDKLNALGEVDYTKKTLHTIIQHVHWSKMG